VARKDSRESDIVNTTGIVDDGGGAAVSIGRSTLAYVRRFFTPGWLGLHLIALVLIGAFLLAGWWQLTRAQDGNLQSWAYVIEWPLFGVFVVAMWVRMVRDELNGAEDRPGQEAATSAERAMPSYDDEDDQELAAYNRRLARLSDEASRG
jgi:DNA-binding transcriptional regulator of glucitol operon